jgi:hypothetical protein
MILPSGEYALVAHPTDWHKRPYVHIDGRWYHFNSRRGLYAAGITEHTVREAILNEGYKPVFFGLKIERPAPARPEFTYTTEAPSRIQEWLNRTTIGVEDVNRTAQAWANLNVTLSEANEQVEDFGDAIESNHTSYSNYTYGRQMEAYQRWIGQRAQGGRVTGGYVTPRETLADRGTRVHLAIADEVQSSYGASQTIPNPNPYHDDTTRRYPTSEQVTSRRRR